MAEQTYIICKTSKKLVRHGFCNLVDDGKFDIMCEVVLYGNYPISPPIEIQAWYWNEVTNQFQKTPV